MASSFTPRYGTTTNGAITYTGNTMGLSKEAGSQNAGTSDAIGALITTQTFLNVATYPTDPLAGTSLTYTEDESFAFLNLPAGSTVLYADLIWGGSYVAGDQNFSTALSANNPVTLTTPIGSYKITADTTSTVGGGAAPSYYLRVANVTSQISLISTGSSRISCGQIIGTTAPDDDTDNAAGWTLCVVYANPTLPSRNMNIYVGNADTFVAVGGDVFNDLIGFQTPISGPVNVRVLATTIEGDANRTGDNASVLAGGAGTTYNNLYGPRNPVNNFFASQICDDSGNLNILGSFGSRNQNSLTATNIVAGRQGWDITNVDGNPTASGNFVNGQIKTTVQFTTSGDRYWVAGFGLQIDVNAPLFTATKAVVQSAASLGDTLNYTLTFQNNGTAATNTGAVITDIIPSGTTYSDNLVVTFNPTTGHTNGYSGIPTTGLTINDPMNVGDTITVTFDVKVTSIPTSLRFVNSASIDYKFNTPTNPNTPGTAMTNSVTTITQAPKPPIVPNYSVTTALNTPVSGTVVAMDPNNLALTYSLNSNPSNGFVSVDANGNWNYTPIVGFVGVDSFTVLVTNADGATAISTITVTVLPQLACEVNCGKCYCKN